MGEGVEVLEGKSDRVKSSQFKLPADGHVDEGIEVLDAGEGLLAVRGVRLPYALSHTTRGSCVDGDEPASRGTRPAAARVRPQGAWCAQRRDGDSAVTAANQDELIRTHDWQIGIHDRHTSVLWVVQHKL
jgi:hypothetical protein